MSDVCGWSENVVVAAGTCLVNDAEMSGLGDKVTGSLNAVEMLPPGGEFGGELIGRDGLTRVDYLTDDISQNGVANETISQGRWIPVIGCDDGRLGVDDLLREVVLGDGEEKLIVWMVEDVA